MAGFDPEPEDFLATVDLMIESTDEFIRDDGVTWDNDPEHRLVDILCLKHVRALFVEVFDPR